MANQLLPLRPYQLDALANVERDLGSGLQRVAVVNPTGTGKTVTLARMTKERHDAGRRTLILVNRDELVSQTVKQLVKAGVDDIGRIKAAWNDVDAPVIVASVQTLASRKRRGQLLDASASRASRIGRVIVDECHHSTAPTYMAVLKSLGCFSPPSPFMHSATAVGFTATMGRGDGVALGTVWQKVSHQYDILDAIRDGWILDAVGIRVRMQSLDLSKVKKSAGDYQDGSLGAAMIDANIPEAAAIAWRDHAEGCAGLAFWPNVASAQAHADELNTLGIPAACVWGAMPMTDRRRVVEDAHAGRIRVLTNCGVATEGFDWPEASVVMIARPTSSAPLYVQMVGRGLRPYGDQTTALVIDLVGVGGRLNLASMADLAGVDVPEGKTMVEAVAEDLETRENDIERSVAAKLTLGQLHAQAFDLFGGSRRAWHRTRRGAWFLSAVDAVVFLAPSPEVGLFNVAVLDTKTARAEYVKEFQELDNAMSWGEQAAAERGWTAGSRARSATWRNGTASTPQCRRASVLGVEPTTNNPDGTIRMLTRGELSDAIDVAEASRAIDWMNVFHTSAWWVGNREKVDA